MSEKIIPFRPRKAPSLMEQQPAEPVAGPGAPTDGEWTLVHVVAQAPPPSR